MESNIQDNTKFYQELLAHLTKTYKNCKKKIKFPTQNSNLQLKYDKEMYPELKQDMFSKFPQLNTWNLLEVDSLLEHQILTPLKSRNFYKLRKLISETIETFLSRLDFLADFEVNAVQKFLEDHFEDNDKIIIDISNEWRIEADRSNLKPDFKVLNEKAQAVYIVLVVYQQLLYFKYEMSDLYFADAQKIKKNTIDQIFKQTELSYPTTFRENKKHFKKCFAECIKEFKETFELNLTTFYTKNPKIGTYIDAYKSSNNYLLNIFKENVSIAVGTTPTEVFLSPYSEKINDTVKDSIIIDKLYKFLMKDTLLLKNSAYADMATMLKNFSYIEDVAINLFDYSKLNGKTNLARLFSIVILTDYLELDEGKYEVYFNKLQLIYLYYMSDLAEEYPQLKDYFELVNSKHKCINNRSMVLHILETLKSKWNEETNSSQNLYAMLCLFLVFNQTHFDTSEKRYTSIDRFMLKCIFRNLKGTEGRFTNFQILCAMETLIMDEDIKKATPNESSSPGKNQQILNQIRNTCLKSAKEHKKYEHQLAPLHPNISPYIKKPEKFFLEKISDPKIHSKTITICVSGFTSENVVKSKEWNYLIEENPFTEVFALNWSSNTLKSLFEFLVKEVKEFSTANSGLLFGFAFPQLRPVLLGMATFQAFKGVKDDLWGKTFEEAITTGVYLAHILSETDLFGDHVVNLVGFSLGTLVIMSCIWELERMNKRDLIYDVLLMGGVVNAADFNKAALNVVGHKIINCYCQKDYILKFLLKMVSYSTNPIGLGPILCAHKKVQNIDVGKKVDGHTKYRDKMCEIIPRVDFNEDLNYLLSA